MYVPPQFQMADPAEATALIAAAPLACIVAQTAEGLVANHIPLVLVGGALIGHVARANDMHRLIAEGQEVMAIFRGAEGYISPNWYPGKAEHHRVVPTWNYEVVHAHGPIQFQHDAKATRAAAGLLTQAQERRTNGAAAWRMADAPPEFTEAMLAAIVAFRIEPLRILGKAKLGQNREAPDREGAAAGLRGQGNAALADRMASGGTDETA